MRQPGETGTFEDDMKALSAAYAAVAAVETADTALICAKVRALMHGYDARYRDAGYYPLAVEQLYTSQLTNPDTGRTSRAFTVAGVVDVLATENGNTVVIDPKTTSQDITDPAGAYWRQLVIEGQVSHYMLLLWQAGIKCDRAVWDVVRKPSISPKALAKKDAAGVAALRRYCGREMSQASIDALCHEQRETLEMYEARLAWDCTHERPDWYFQRRAIPRLDNELLDYARELWEHGQEIHAAHRSGRHARNSGACLLYGSPCVYLGICSGYDTTDSDRWQIKHQVHRELPITGDGRRVLTNSRIRCFQTCRRKEHYQYVLGIERRDDEEREALLFGTIYHEAQRAWWETLKGEANGNCAESPATAVGNSTAAQAADAGGCDNYW